VTTPAHEGTPTGDEALQRAAHTAAVARLARGVAHDFNNMLSVIMGRAALALDQVEAGHPARRQLETIQEAGERLSSQARKLLSFAQGRAGAPEVLDPAVVLRELEPLLRPVVGGGVGLRVVAPDVGRVETRRTQLEQTLINLAANAREAMSEGGTLTLELDREELSTDGARELGAAPGVYVRLRVSDTGAGLDPGVRSRMCEPFFTTRPDRAGLGLAGLEEALRREGGALRVTSAPGQGTTFTLLFPPAGPAPSAAGSESEAAPVSGSVLVAEASELVRELMVDALEGAGHRVRAAESAEEALRLAGEEAPKVLVLNLRLGAELSGRVRDAHPQTLIAVLAPLAEAAEAAEPDAVLLEPLDPTLLLDTVNGLLIC
jgi:CheY-like chemotaxis protein